MSLSRYIITRSIVMFLVFLVSIIFFFIFVRALPVPLSGGSLFLPSQTDPFLMSVLRNQDDPRFTGLVEFTIRTFGLDRPLIPDQLLLFLKNVFTFDFGYSLYSNRKVSDEILARLPYTLALYVFATIVPIVFGYYVSLYLAKTRGKALDTLLTLSGIAAFVMPPWIMLLLIYIVFAYIPKTTFGVYIVPLPVRPPSPSELSLSNIAYWLWYLTPLYVASLISFFGSWAYFFRQLVIAEMGNEYVTTARAKGLSDETIIFREITPNLKPPIVTRLAYAMPGIFGGSIAIEILSSWPGIAYYAYQAFQNYDYPVILAFFVVSAMLVVISLYLADVIIAIIDPRVRIGER